MRDSITIRYTHGLGIDQPLSLIRNGKRVIPHANVRGLYFDFTDDTGVRLCPPTKLCSIAVLGSALKTSSYQTPLDPGNLRSKTWYGSLVMGSTDPNGLMYRRNRYYNPETGRFTQMRKLTGRPPCCHIRPDAPFIRNRIAVNPQAHLTPIPQHLLNRYTTRLPSP
ncbi:MAG: hypothetical protein LBG44_03540 [Gemmatimonadota bacterium]|nr:hypothetical protein [Gemmatimonadota bacterium]